MGKCTERGKLWGKRTIVGTSARPDRGITFTGDAKAPQEESRPFYWRGVLTTEKKIVTITKS